MNELLARIVDAHGGMDRWKGYAQVEATRRGPYSDGCDDGELVTWSNSHICETQINCLLGRPAGRFRIWASRQFQKIATQFALVYNFR